MSSTQTGTTARATAGRGRSLAVVIGLCWAFVLIDGLDTFVFSAAMPTVLKTKALGITPGTAGDLGSYATFGMLVGALAAGTVTEWIGRKKVALASVVVFSLASALTAAAGSSGLFGFARFLCGLGLGGLLPLAISYGMEYSAPQRRSLMVGVVITAHQAGGMLAAAVGMWMIPSLGWRSVFWLGAVPFVILVPLGLRLLPESLGYLVAKGRQTEAAALAERYGVPVPQPAEAGGRRGIEGLKALFANGTWLTTLLFWGTSFTGLLLVYGFGNWLPSMMRESGYDLGSSVSFLMVINLGGIVGLLTAGRLSDRVGPMRVTVLWFLATAAGIGLMVVHLPLAVTYLVVFLTGAFLFSAQGMVYASVGSRHSAEDRGVAMGWVAGVGRWGAVFGPWLGGQLVAAGATKWGFGAYALDGLLGAVLMSLALLTVRARRTAPVTS